MSLANRNNRLAIATTRELIVFADAKTLAKTSAKTLAPLYPKKPDHYDAIFVPRMSYYTAYCDLRDMAFDKQIVIVVTTRFSCISVPTTRRVT